MNHVRTAMWSLLGILTASTAWGVSINAGTVVGGPGETVSFNVNLSTMGQRVGATGNVIPIDNQTPIIACRINPLYAASFSAIAFRPDGCTKGVNCTTIKAIVISTPPGVLRNNTNLYTCDVRIGALTPDGSYPVLLEEVEASTADGIPISDVVGNDGAVIVGPTPTPTITPTPNPNPPTVTPTRRPTKTRTQTPTPTPTTIPLPEDDDACQMVAPSRARVGWLLLLPAAVLWRLRRRR